MDELYVIARRVLLDALDDLGDHRDAGARERADQDQSRTPSCKLGIAAWRQCGLGEIQLRVYSPDRETEMALTEKQIDEAVARYEREYDRYVKLAEIIYQRCQEVLARMSARATIQRRAKAPASLKKKLLTMMSNPEKAKRFNSPDDVFVVLSDLAGVRVATYLESDRDRIVREIRQEFSGPKDTADPEVEVKDGKSKSPHYRATHCQVRIPDDELPENAWNLKGAACEVQVCSLLAHVWNEIEHDLKYKPESGQLVDTEIDLLEQLACLTKAGDISIRQLLSATDQRLAERTGEFVDVHDFVARMREVFPGAANFGDNAGQLLDELQRMGLNTPDKVLDELQLMGLNTPEKAKSDVFDANQANPEQDAKSTLSGLQNHLTQRGDKVVVDDTSSDLMLALLLKKKAHEIIDAHPFGPGKGRPSRLVYLARRYQEWQDGAESSAPSEEESDAVSA